MMQLRNQTGIQYDSFYMACLIACCGCLILATSISAFSDNIMTKQAISACPDSPNCVSSLEVGTKHYIEPLRYQGSMKDAKKRLLDVINSFERTQVIEDDGNYISTTFTSFLFRFTDDVEFLLDDNSKLIDMKSASRVGYSDLGANRRRCEAIRKIFNR